MLRSSRRRSGPRPPGPKARLAAVLSLPLLAWSAAHDLARAEGTVYRLPEVTIEGEWVPPAPTTAIAPDEPNRPPAADGGDLLRAIPGVSAGRMGGHGLEPVIRGQQQDQINVLSDGAFIFGAGPNRMDPPTSHVPVETYDRVTIIKGYQSVLYGAGGTGGTVLFERDPPRFAADKPWRVRAGGGLGGNGWVRDAFADAAVGGRAGFVRGIGTWKEAENYEDGGGNEVRSAFLTRFLDLTVGWTPVEGSLLSLGLAAGRQRDVLFPGAGMDSPETDADTVRVSAVHEVDGAHVRRLRAEGSYSVVDHVMDNFSLRPLAGGTARRVEAESDTVSGRVVAELALAGVPLSVGADLRRIERRARRFQGPSAAQVGELQSVLWPDARTREIGLFAEATVEVADDLRLKVGGRYDNVHAAAEATDRRSAATGNSPDDLYRSFYGRTAESVTEHNVGGLLRLEWDPRPDLTVFAGLSRSLRTADATERFLASDMMAMSWVGNPGLEPEAHHQLDLGAAAGGTDWSFSATVFADRVSDFIMRDTARGQAGILQANGATVYRNIEAFLGGGEIEGVYRIGRRWLVTANLAYVLGENLDDDRPLAQIPPLEGTLEVAYQADGWTLGARMRAAARQTRVDADPALGSGRDVGETPGYAVFDLFGAVGGLGPFELRVGVTNLFDKTYANHLNRSNLVDPEEVRVNEPGRSAYVRLRAAF